ncbi:hypothetical protein HPB47_010599 [Ixodes persulcatus]|uniref:Uncharacterized protein n=1 Tax=Ixodes persulcatus TaxID=34615 RepID=A0AC60NYK6_IXOPE|nr:hypothetical protein HPB47_010599 [Ixodes persulcatus]
MTSQPSSIVLESATNLPSCSQQTPARRDHTYNATQDTQTGHSTLGKRRNDGDGEPADLLATPAKLQPPPGDSMEEDLIEGDLEGFVLASHRRQRTTGIPVLLTPVNEEQRLQRQNPLTLSTEVNEAAAAAILRHRFTNRGGLMVEVAETTTVDRLLKLRLLGGVPVKATVPRTYLQNGGLVKGVPLWHTDAEITSFLQQDGVIAARRLYRRQGKSGEAAQPTDRVLLTFRPNTDRPSRVNLGFTKHDVTEFIEAPTRCYNCQALGHVVKYCKGAAKCKKCAQSHSTKDCKGEAPFKCANCGGDHPASYVNCKARLTALSRTKRFVHGPKVAPSTNEAEIPQGPWPPLESSTADLQTTQDTVPPALNLKDSPPKGKSKKSRPAAKPTLMDNQWPPRDPASASGELNASGVPPSTASTRPHSKTSTGALPRQQQAQFSKIHQLFLKHNTAVPSSASVERLFSSENATQRCRKRKVIFSSIEDVPSSKMATTVGKRARGEATAAGCGSESSELRKETTQTKENVCKSTVDTSYPGWFLERRRASPRGKEDGLIQA